jgi:hypothetical protein
VKSLVIAVISLFLLAGRAAAEETQPKTDPKPAPQAQPGGLQVDPVEEAAIQAAQAEKQAQEAARAQDKLARDQDRQREKEREKQLRDKEKEKEKELRDKEKEKEKESRDRDRDARAREKEARQKESQAREERRTGKGGEDAEKSLALIDQIGSLRKDAVRAKREGDLDRAKKLWAEADRLDEDLRGSVEENRPGKEEVTLRVLSDRVKELTREGQRGAESVRRQAADLRKMAEALAHDGNSEDGEKLRSEARRLEERAATHAKDQEQRSNQLRQEADRAAQKVRLEVTAARGRSSSRTVKPNTVPPKPQPAAQVIIEPVNGKDDLRKEVDRLRSEVRELRDMLKKSLESRPGREDGKPRLESVSVK